MFKPAIILLLLAARGAGAEPAPSSRKQLVIVDSINFTTTGLPKSVHERERFFVVLTQKLREKGWTALAPISESLCSSNRDCLGYIGQESHAPYLLRLTGEGNLKLGYTLHLQLYSVATKHSQRTNTFCEICVTDGIATSVADLSLGLLAEAARDDVATAKDLRKTDAPVATSSARNSALVSPPTAATGRGRVSWLPWSMIGVGVIGLGCGVWILHEDGQPSGSAHGNDTGMPLVLREHHASKSLGVVTLVAAGAVAAGGVIWLALTPSRSATVAVSPNQVALTLRY